MKESNIKLKIQKRDKYLCKIKNNMKGKLNMDILDYKEVKKHIDILNVAYQLCLEMVEEKGFETRAICPFCRIQ